MFTRIFELIITRCLIALCWGGAEAWMHSGWSNRVINFWGIIECSVKRSLCLCRHRACPDTSSMERRRCIFPRVAWHRTSQHQLFLPFPVRPIPVYNQHPSLLRESVCEKFSSRKQWIRFLRGSRKDFCDWIKETISQEIYFTFGKKVSSSDGRIAEDTEDVDKIFSALFVSILRSPVKRAVVSRRNFSDFSFPMRESKILR